MMAWTAQILEDALDWPPLVYLDQTQCLDEKGAQFMARVIYEKYGSPAIIRVDYATDCYIELTNPEVDRALIPKLSAPDISRVAAMESIGEGGVMDTTRTQEEIKNAALMVAPILIPPSGALARSQETLAFAADVSLDRESGVFTIRAPSQRWWPDQKTTVEATLSAGKGREVRMIHGCFTLEISDDLYTFTPLRDEHEDEAENKPDYSTMNVYQLLREIAAYTHETDWDAPGIEIDDPELVTAIQDMLNTPEGREALGEVG